MKYIFILAVAFLAGCSGHHLTGYNIKPTIGQTADLDTGKRTLYTGASVDAHFDVK